MHLGVGKRRRLAGLAWLALITALAAGVAIAAWRSGLLNAPERAALDARFTGRGTVRPNRDLTIVAVDNNSLEHVPYAWPFPRSVYGRLIDILHGDGARLIVFDIAFDKPRSGDAALASAARRAAPVVFGTAEIDRLGQTSVLGGPAAQRRIGARVGSLDQLPDPDGVFRHMIPGVNGLQSLPLVAAEALGTRVVGLTSQGPLIDYAGPARTVPTYSFDEAVAGHLSARLFRGRVVLIGVSAPILQDIHATPFGEMSGVEIEANELGTVLDHLPLTPVSDLVTALIVILLAAVPALTWAVRPALLAVGLGSLLGASAILVASQVAFDDGAVVEVSAPLLALLLSAAGTVGYGYIGADRERRRLREEFAAFSPQVVDAVLGDQGALPPTAVIGGYRVDSLLGRGGMAAVYRATQLALDRPVALKLIAPALARERVYSERFLRESRLAATVEHPHVIPIYEAGDDDGLLFIAMRYVDGVDLGAVLRRLGPLEAADAVRICSQLAGALDAAHARGLVHRDVKPANVLLDVELEHAYLADFGVAGLEGASSGLTVEGGFIGTPDYAAPEQARGVAVDHRADIYALGGVLFHSLTGVPPYQRDTLIALIAAHETAPVPEPSSVNPALAPFDPVIARAMAKQPDDRFDTARELAAAARAALDGVAAP